MKPSRSRSCWRSVLLLVAGAMAVVVFIAGWFSRAESRFWDRRYKQHLVGALRTVDSRADDYRDSFFLSVNEGDGESRTLRIALLLRLLSDKTYPALPPATKTALRGEIASAKESGLPPEGLKLLGLVRARLTWWSGPRSRPFRVMIDGTLITAEHVDTFLGVFPSYRYEPGDRPVPAPLFIRGYEAYDIY